MAVFREQNPGTTARIILEVVLENGKVAWVNDGAEGDLETTGEQASDAAVMKRLGSSRFKRSGDQGLQGSINVSRGSNVILLGLCMMLLARHHAPAQESLKPCK